MFVVNTYIKNKFALLEAAMYQTITTITSELLLTSTFVEFLIHLYMKIFKCTNYVEINLHRSKLIYFKQDICKNMAYAIIVHICNKRFIPCSKCIQGRYLIKSRIYE